MDLAGTADGESRPREKDGIGVGCTAIIVDYCSARDTLGLAAVLVGSSDITQVVIVDNGGALSKEDVDGLRDTEVVHPETNLGFGTAVNLAAQRALGDILLILNPDVTLSVEQISKLVRNATRLGAVVAPVVVHSQNPKECGYGRLPSVRAECLAALGFRTSRRSCSAVEWVSGACFSIPRVLFERLGGFDERFFLYYEETDLWQRAKYMGCVLMVLRDVHVFHDGGTTPLQLRGQFMSSRLRFFQKHHSRRDVAIVKIAWLIGTVLRSISDTCRFRWPSLQGRKAEFRALLNGTVERTGRNTR